MRLRVLLAAAIISSSAPPAGARMLALSLSGGSGAPKVALPALTTRPAGSASIAAPISLSAPTLATAAGLLIAPAEMSPAPAPAHTGSGANMAPAPAADTGASASMLSDVAAAQDEGGRNFDGAGRRRGLVAAGVAAAAATLKPAAAAAQGYYDRYGYYVPAPPEPLIDSAALPEYGLAALGVGAVVALFTGIVRSSRAVPPTRRRHPVVGALKALAAGGITGGALFGGLVSRDFFMGPADPWMKLAAGAAWAAAAVAAGFWVNTVRRDRAWRASKSYADVLKVEEAREAKDAAALDRLGIEARHRHERMSLRIQEAERLGSKTIMGAGSAKVSDAKRLAAFDLLAAGRAELNENAVSTDPNTRIGKETPNVWKEKLERGEAEAVSSGFEGKLALQLKRLEAELGAQDGVGKLLENELGAFKGFIPKLFGGQLASEAKRGEADLTEFREDEVGAEQGLRDRINAAMRKRVSDRLYSERADFRQHRDRLDRLVALHDGPVKTALETARYIDERLADAISHFQDEQTQLALAAANSAVPVTVTETDSKGNTTTRVEIQDHSGPYRAAAAIAASAAASAASDAEEGLSRLGGELGTLYNDSTIADEDLRAWVPAKPGTSVDGGSGMVSWVMPGLFQLFSSMGSESSVESTRAEFASTLSSLGSLSSEVGSRRAGEQGWVDGEIDQDLAKQMEKAGG